MSDTPEPYAWVILILLSCLSGVFSGLNLGLMSLTCEDLDIIINSSKDEKEIKYAKTIKPIRKSGNLLLCTLLIGNTVVNVLLAVVTDPIWTFLFGEEIAGQVLSLVVPSVIIVLFGEIIPQSVCSRYALAVGYYTRFLTYVFIVFIYPAAKPIAMILDKVLGDEISGIYTRQNLFELIKLNATSTKHMEQSGLTQEDARLLGGALTFRDRYVSDVMTPLQKVYGLPLSTVFDGDTFKEILRKGHTRIPVYDGDKSNIKYVLLVKNLLGIGFERKLTLESLIAEHESEFFLQALCIEKGKKLGAAFNMCKKGTHLLIVVDDPPEGVLEGVLQEEGLTKRAAVGLITVEDVLEEILQEEIVDETDVYVSNEASTLNEQKANVPVMHQESVRLATLNSRRMRTTTVLSTLTNKGETDVPEKITETSEISQV